MTNSHIDKFDYMLSNPPFGVDWKRSNKILRMNMNKKALMAVSVQACHVYRMVHYYSWCTWLARCVIASSTDEQQVAGSGLSWMVHHWFTGSAGSGESEIRRYILEADLLEAIIALPNDMFYNTGIATYIWVLSNKKDAERKGKVQLINGRQTWYSKMRKSLGSKRNWDELKPKSSHHYPQFRWLWSGRHTGWTRRSEVKSWTPVVKTELQNLCQ